MFIQCVSRHIQVPQRKLRDRNGRVTSGAEMGCGHWIMLYASFGPRKLLAPNVHPLLLKALHERHSDDGNATACGQVSLKEDRGDRSDSKDTVGASRH